jgi:hypothetical protein
MPRRSNPFQQLIRLLHEQLHAPHAVVESDMLVNRGSHEATEVDVVIRADIGSLQLLTSVECIDRSRPASVGWVREMFEKHRELPTNQLILVSKLGFTKQAKSNAERLGIIPLTLESAENVDWTEYVHRLHSVVVMGLWALTGVVAHAPTYEGDGEWVLPLETRFFDPNGVVQATAKEIADAVWMKPYLRAKLLEFADMAEGEGSLIRLPLAKGASMQLPSGEMHLVDFIDVVMLLDQLNTTIQLQSKSYFDAQIAFGRAHSGNRELLLSIVERAGRPVNARVAVVENGALVDSVTLAGQASNASLSPASDEALRALMSGNE